MKYQKLFDAAVSFLESHDLVVTDITHSPARSVGKVIVPAGLLHKQVWELVAGESEANMYAPVPPTFVFSERTRQAYLGLRFVIPTAGWISKTEGKENSFNLEFQIDMDGGDFVFLRLPLSPSLLDYQAGYTEEHLDGRRPVCPECGVHPGPGHTPLVIHAQRVVGPTVLFLCLGDGKAPLHVGYQNDTRVWVSEKVALALSFSAQAKPQWQVHFLPDAAPEIFQVLNKKFGLNEVIW